MGKMYQNHIQTNTRHVMISILINYESKLIHIKDMNASYDNSKVFFSAEQYFC